MSRIRANQITNQSADGAPTVQNGLVISGVTTSTTLSISDTLSHSGDNDTKIRFPSADTVSIETGGNEQIRINHSSYIQLYNHIVPNNDSTKDIGLTGTRFRAAYVDTYYGDGSNLTGITGTTINSNADNRLITGSGTANTLNAESDITYDGTILALAGGKYINCTSPYRVAGHPVLGYDNFTDISGGSYATRLGSTGTSTLTSTQIYGGGSHLATFDGVNSRLGLRTTTPAKDLHVYNPSVSTVRIETGDSRGQAWDILSTNGAQNNTGTLSFRDESGASYMEFGANGGSPQFRVRNGGSNDLLYVDSGGRVTKPLQPSFAAYKAANSFTQSGVIVFDATRHNIGSHYNTSNGRFTAPVSGRYQFTFFSIILGSYTSAYYSIRINGSAGSGMYVHVSKNVSGWDNVCTTWILNLNASDYVDLNSNSSINWHGNDWQLFSGELLS